jgi:hypothetical protein
MPWSAELQPLSFSMVMALSFHVEEEEGMF